MNKNRIDKFLTLALSLYLAYYAGVNLKDYLDQRRHLNLALAWIDNAKYVAEISKNPEARYLYDYLQKYAVIGVPNDQGFITTIKEAKVKDPKHNFFFMPFFSGEQDAPDFQWKHKIEVKGNFSIVTFTSKKEEINARVLTLPDGLSQYNRLVSGLIILHETWHASDLSVWKNPNEGNCLFEARAYGFNMALLREIGGDAYIHLVRARVPFRNQQEELSVEQFFQMNPQLNLLFGPFVDFDDKLMIRKIFLLDLDVTAKSANYAAGIASEVGVNGFFCEPEYKFGGRAKRKTVKAFEKK